MSVLETVVIGGGQAGLGLSHYLQRDGRRHVVFEQGRIGESWLSQRWNSFRLNTPNFMNALPGLPYDGSEPTSFCRADELVHYFQRYVEHFDLPVRPGVSVVSVEQGGRGGNFVVRTRRDGQAEESLIARSVVVASGVQRVPKVSPMRSRMASDILQLHTSDYRAPGALPPGAIVIVGSGQSGCQIAEDLLSTGRTVFLCTSKVGRAPRRYRGRDILEWWIDMKFLDVTYASLQDKSISRAPQPQVSGLGDHGHSVSLQHLARQGATILGRLLAVDGNVIFMGEDAAANTQFADEFSQRLKNDVETYLGKAGITPPPLEEDPADEPDPRSECASSIRQLNLHEAGVSTVIWATGFTGDFSWLRLPVFDSTGMPIHEGGASTMPGLYFIGFPWLKSRKSGIIYGISEDARHIADAVGEHLA